MSGNSMLVPAPELGWRTGLSNLLRAEMRSWWKTRTWWVQSLIWIAAVDLILLTIVNADGAVNELSEAGAELAMLYGIFGGMFASVGCVILMQSALVGEKLSGTAAWVLSKPISRTAFVLAKWLANTLGVAVTVVLLPGLGAYAILNYGFGGGLSFGNFLGGMSLVFLFNLYWLSLTLMLGAYFNNRGAVIGLPLFFILGQQFIQGFVAQISPGLMGYLPYSLIMENPNGGGGTSLAAETIMGAGISDWGPIFVSVLSIFVFLALAVWRFNREEL